jgi:TRAP-type C4-dicarboxylate transport system permease small subunit
VSTYRQREQKKEKTKPRSSLFSCVYVVIVIAAAFVLSSLIMRQLDLYDLLGLDRAEIPFLDIPGRDIPQWALQLVLGIAIFFILQPLVYITAALLGAGKAEEDYGQPHRNPWEN